MELEYVSTRGDKKPYPASKAIIRGLSEDGGLFVPLYIPKLERSMASLKGCGYKEIAYEVMKLFFTDYTEEELKDCIEKAYDAKFDTDEIAPCVCHDGQWFLELFHGPTIAFKDMALSILPHLLTCALKKNRIDDEIVIMTATSGDTGKAALEAFADVKGTRIIVFYPKGGVSAIQERQMVTQKGANTRVVGVRGNFDDCQSAVKAMFNKASLNDEIGKRGYRFSSANSINIGRLIPQVAYYVYVYVKMLEKGAISEGEKIDPVVPTGNFGNILAGFYAKQMGVPFDKLVCASNENKVLYDFFDTGTYDANRDFILTTSPSMDILISSNLERLIYHSTGDNAEVTAGYMRGLSEEGKYSVSDDSRRYTRDFVGIYASEQDCADMIRSYHKSSGYVIDPHTAVAAYANSVHKGKSSNKTVIVSTASPYKFAGSVLSAIDPALVSDEDMAMAEKLSEISKVPIPAAVERLWNAPVLHDTVCDVDKMQSVVEEWLK